MLYNQCHSASLHWEKKKNTQKQKRNLMIKICNSFIETHYKISFFSAGVRQIKIDSIWSTNNKDSQGVIKQIAPSLERFVFCSQFLVVAVISLSEKILIKPIHFPSKVLEDVHTLIKKNVNYHLYLKNEGGNILLFCFKFMSILVLKKPKWINQECDGGSERRRVLVDGRNKIETHTFIIHVNILSFEGAKYNYRLGACQGLKSIWYTTKVAFIGDSVMSCTKTYPP